MSNKFNLIIVAFRSEDTTKNNCIVLLDTYDTINSGLQNAIRLEKEYLEPNGYHLKGVRIDSGDIAYLK